jgi:hypothetical protein
VPLALVFDLVLNLGAAPTRTGGPVKRSVGEHLELCDHRRSVSSRTSAPNHAITRHRRGRVETDPTTPTSDSGDGWATVEGTANRDPACRSQVSARRCVAANSDSLFRSTIGHCGSVSGGCENGEDRSLRPGQ